MGWFDRIKTNIQQGDFKLIYKNWQEVNETKEIIKNRIKLVFEIKQLR